MPFLPRSAAALAALAAGAAVAACSGGGAATPAPATTATSTGTTPDAAAPSSTRGGDPHPGSVALPCHEPPTVPAPGLPDGLALPPEARWVVVDDRPEHRHDVAVLLGDPPAVAAHVRGALARPLVTLGPLQGGTFTLEGPSTRGTVTVAATCGGTQVALDLSPL